MRIATQNRHSGEVGGLLRAMPGLQKEYAAIQDCEIELDHKKVKWEAVVADLASMQPRVRALEKSLATLSHGCVLVAEAHGLTGARDVLETDAGDSASMASRIAEHVKLVPTAGVPLAHRLARLRGELIAAEARYDAALKAFESATKEVNGALLKSSWVVGDARLQLVSVGVRLKRRVARKPKVAPATVPVPAPATVPAQPANLDTTPTEVTALARAS